MRWYAAKVLLGFALAGALMGQAAAPAGHTVRGIGQGETVREALEQALIAAIEQAVGVHVEGVTLLTGEVIQSRIATFSNGYVQRYKELTRQTRNGIVEITIEAVVFTDRSLEPPRPAPAIRQEVDGPSLVARGTTILRQVNDSRRVIATALNGFPLNCIVAKVGAPEVDKVVGESTKLTVPLTFEIDSPAFNRTMADLRSALEAVGAKGQPVSATAYDLRTLTQAKDAKTQELAVRAKYFLGHDIPNGIPLYAFLEMSSPQPAIVAGPNRGRLIDQVDGRAATSSSLAVQQSIHVLVPAADSHLPGVVPWMQYDLNPDQAALFPARSAKQVTVVVALMDETGQTLTSYELPTSFPDGMHRADIMGVRGLSTQCGAVNLLALNPIERFGNLSKTPGGQLAEFSKWFRFQTSIASVALFSPQVRIQTSVTIRNDLLQRVRSLTAKLTETPQ